MRNDEQIKAIEIMASQPEVKDAVIKSHDNNPWWPKDVKDWRMKMLVAGLSTRVSFRMLGSYTNTINNFLTHTYDEIKETTDDDLRIMLKPLGLPDARIKFVRSMSQYIDKSLKFKNIENISNTELIDDIAKNVDGASYKVGQCCVLYAKGYYCGVMPVDSGMKDMLAPCLGYKTGKTAIAHETVREQLEAFTKSHDWIEIANKLGYDKKITLPKDKPLTWWVHLVMINYKRHFCNNRKPNECPLLKAGIPLSAIKGCQNNILK